MINDIFVNNDVRTCNNGYEMSENARINDFYTDLTNAVEKATGESKGKVLGLTMIPYDEYKSYGMAASYSDRSTDQDPIIRVSSNYGGEQRYYEVHVNKVNPSRASQLEMFALLSYQDDVGITDRGTFGTYNKMRVFASDAEHSGFCDGINDYESFLSKEIDWISVINTMMKTYMKNVASYSQGIDCGKIMDKMINWKQERGREYELIH